MYQRIRLSNFRTFETLNIDGFDQVNLITGRNGTGKTALLEALFMNSGGTNTHLVISLSNFRGESFFSPQSDRPFRTLFHQLGYAKPIEIVAHWKGVSDRNVSVRTLSIAPLVSSETPQNQSASRETITGLEFKFRSGKSRATSMISWKESPRQRSSSTFNLGSALNVPSAPGPENSQLKLSSATALSTPLWPSLSESAAMPNTTLRLVAENPKFVELIPAIFVLARYYDVAAQIYAQITAAAKDRKLKSIVETMKIIDDRVKDILPLSEQGLESIYVDVGGDQLVPLSMMGAGFFNALNIAASIVTAEQGVVLIDEIEDGIHYSAFPALIRSICTIVRGRPVQLFITTHSDDVISALAQASEELKFHDVSSFKFTRTDHRVYATKFASSEIIEARDIGLELR